MPQPKIVNTQVVIIGAGGAGARAAIAAHDKGAKVLVLSKSNIGRAHTTDAEGGVNSALRNVDKRDSWRVHAKDTLKEGYFLGEKKAVEILAKEAPARVRELARMGMPFDKTADSKIDQRWMAAHTYRRTSYASDKTGFFLLQTLIKQAQKRKIAFKDGMIAVKLLVRAGQLEGVLALDYNTGQPLVIKCRSVVLAAGGYTRIYQKTSHADEAYGDGAGLAYRAGCELMDMEMVQFHPTGMITPKAAAGILVTEAMRGMGAKLFNAKGERFMKKYDPSRLELAPRDVVARAIWTEIKAGRGTKHGGVWEDVTHVKASLVKKKLSKMYEQFKFFAKIDITKQPFEVAPTAHYCMGGIKLNPMTSQTCITGVFAAGEIDAGVHGANRLGGNSLADILVFGRQAGNAAAKLALTPKTSANRQGALGRGQTKDLDQAVDRDQAGPPDQNPEPITQKELIKQALVFLKNPHDPLNTFDPVHSVDLPGLSTDRALAKQARAKIGDLKTLSGPGNDPTRLKEKLRKITEEHAGLAKTAADLKKGLKKLENLEQNLAQVRIKGSLKQNKKWLDLFEAGNMLICAKALMRSALMRQESRGAHYRLDFPKRDDKKWLAHIIVGQKNGRMTLFHKAI